MTTSVRERHARLLADVRAAEPRARLSQAASRASFLLRVSRTVSAIQNPERALEAVVALLLEDMVDVAQVVVRTGPWQLSAAGVQGGEPRSRAGRWVDEKVPAFEETFARGLVEDIILPAAGEERRRVLASLFVDDATMAEVEALGAEQVVVLPIAARGRSLGLLVLGRGGGFGFGGAQGFLDDLADRVAVGLDANLVVAESQYVASVLRRSLAPLEAPRIPGLAVATFYRVAHQSEHVGGDFLDVFERGDEVIALCGDVAGKGVEAAVAAKRIRNAVRTASMVDRGPAWVLDLVNRVLVSEADGFSEQLATAVCVRLRHEGDRATVVLASAGHPPTYVLRADGTVEAVDATGVALALLDDSDYAEARLHLAAGDTLVLYTDGVTEARGADGLFGDDRLRAQLRRVASLPPSAIVESVAVAVSEHLGDRTHDDIAILALQLRPGET